jgi:hypothetical protein
MLYVCEHGYETFDSIILEFIDQLNTKISFSMNTSIWCVNRMDVLVSW